MRGRLVQLGLIDTHFLEWFLFQGARRKAEFFGQGASGHTQLGRDLGEGFFRAEQQVDGL